MKNIYECVFSSLPVSYTPDAPGVITTNPKAIVKAVIAKHGFRPSRHLVWRGLRANEADGRLTIIYTHPTKMSACDHNPTIKFRYTTVGIERRTEINTAPIGKQYAPADSGLDPKSQAIINTLTDAAVYFKKTYCYLSQATIIARCKDWYGVTMSNRTLNRHLGQLEEASYIERTTRHRKTADGTWEYRSTLYKIMSSAYAWLKKTVKWASKFLNSFALPQMANYPFINKELLQKVPPNEDPSGRSLSPEALALNKKRVRELILTLEGHRR